MLFTEKLSHETKRHLIILTVLFVASAVFGYSAATLHPEEASKLLDTILRDIKERIGSLDKVSLFFFIFGTNTAKAFLAMVFGTFFGIVPVLFVMFNGFVLGLVVLWSPFPKAYVSSLSVSPRTVFSKSPARSSPLPTASCSARPFSKSSAAGAPSRPPSSPPSANSVSWSSRSSPSLRLSRYL